MSSGPRREAATVMSIVARLLTEPSYLAQFMRDRHEALSTYRTPPIIHDELLALDAERVRHFGALISKVQHNLLWKCFGGTLYVLKQYGVELNVFAEYRRSSPPMHANVSAEERVRRFLDFLPTILASAPSGSLYGLSEVLEHERNIWEIECALTRHRNVRPKACVNQRGLRPWNPRNLVPRFRGVVQFAAYPFNPNELKEKLRANCLRRRHAVQIRRARTKRCRLLYWGDPESMSVRVFQLPIDLFSLLQLVDGRQSVEQLASVWHPRDQSVSASSLCRKLLERASQAGVILFVTASKPSTGDRL